MSKTNGADCPSCGQRMPATIEFYPFNAKIDGQILSFDHDSLLVLQALYTATGPVSHDYLTAYVLGRRESIGLSRDIVDVVNRIRRTLSGTRVGIEPVWIDAFRLVVYREPREYGAAAGEWDADADRLLTHLIRVYSPKQVEEKIACRM